MASRRSHPVDHAKEAACHHTTLSTFASVVALLEGGVVYDPAAHGTKQRIIQLCHAEQQRQLAKYDAALARVIAGAKEDGR